MDDRGCIDPAAIPLARRHVPATQRRRRPSSPRTTRPYGRRALLRQQHRRRRRRAAGRLLVDPPRWPARNGARGRSDEHHRRPRRLPDRALVAGVPAPAACGPGRRRYVIVVAVAPCCLHPLALRHLRHRGGFVHLRDHLDPHAVAGAGQRHAQFRPHALRLHSRTGARRAVRAHGGRPQPDAVARVGLRAVDDGRARAPDPAGLRRVLRLDRRAAADVHPHARRLRRLQSRALRAVPRGHAAGDLLRRDDAAAPHQEPADQWLGRARARLGLLRQHAGLDPRRRPRRPGAAAAARPAHAAPARRRRRHGARRARARLLGWFTP